jgi:hypothetical protein
MASRALRTNLDMSWAQHMQILHNAMLEPATQLGSKVAGPFSDDVQVWGQRMQECYDALHILASALETNAVAMSEQDQSTGQNWQQMEQ